MTQYTDATRKKVVRQHIQDGRTLKSLAAEYGVSVASISNWIRAYREECQTNDEEKTHDDGFLPVGNNDMGRTGGRTDQEHNDGAGR